MRLAAKGVSCNSTLETMISLIFGGVYAEKKEKMKGKRTERFVRDRQAKIPGSEKRWSAAGRSLKRTSLPKKPKEDQKPETEQADRCKK